MRLVEQSEPASEVDALGDAAEITDRVDDLGTYGRRLTDRAPWLEMVGMKIDQTRDVHAPQTGGQFLDEGGMTTHRVLISSRHPREVPYQLSASEA